MKLATLNDGTRDGQLVVVARDLKTAQLADGVARTLQAALDDWPFIFPQLDFIYQQLNQGRGHRSFEFMPENCLAPLPRPFQRAEGASYLKAQELDCQARGVDIPASLRSEPAMQQDGGDVLGPMADILLAHGAWGIDFGAQVAVICDDIDVNPTPDQALLGIRLLLLGNAVTLRNLVVDERIKGAGLLQARPATAYSPVAVTPDELGDAWKSGKVHLPLRASLNGKLLGQPHAGADMAFNFPQLIAHLGRTRRVGAGTIVGAGPVLNKDARRGVCCLFDKRNGEIVAKGEALTPYLGFGDVVRIDMQDEDGKSVFGAIEQTLRQGQVTLKQSRTGP